MINRTNFFAAVLALIATMASFAQANLVTFNFTGSVNQVDPLLTSSFALGDTIVGTYTFDSKVPDKLPSDPTAGIYTSNTSYSVRSGSFLSSGSGFDLNIFNELVLPSGLFRDQYRAALGAAGPTVNGLTYNGFSLDLFTTSATSPTSSPLKSDKLREQPPAINLFANNQLRFYFITSTGGVDYVVGSVSTLTRGRNAAASDGGTTMCLLALAVSICLGANHTLRRQSDS